MIKIPQQIQGWIMATMKFENLCALIKFLKNRNVKYTNM